MMVGAAVFLFGLALLGLSYVYTRIEHDHRKELAEMQKHLQSAVIEVYTLQAHARSIGAIAPPLSDRFKAAVTDGLTGGQDK